MQTLPDYHLDALFRAAMEDEAEALASTAASESQMLERVGQLLARRRKRRQLVTLLLAAALTTLTAAAIALGGSRLTPPVTPERSPEASATPEGSLPALGLPGSRAAGSGEYGWTAHWDPSPGCTASRGASCLESSDRPSSSSRSQMTASLRTDAEPVPVTVAGLDGLYVEPYEDPGCHCSCIVTERETTTGAYALAIGDRTLCVYLTWDPDSDARRVAGGPPGAWSPSVLSPWPGRNPDQLHPCRGDGIQGEPGRPQQGGSVRRESGGFRRLAAMSAVRGIGAMMSVRGSERPGLVGRRRMTSAGFTRQSRLSCAMSVLLVGVAACSAASDPSGTIESPQHPSASSTDAARHEPRHGSSARRGHVSVLHGGGAGRMVHERWLIRDQGWRGSHRPQRLGRGPGANRSVPLEVLDDHAGADR